ncbi:hypothetical protein [Acetobacterium sp.]|uniref:hypothetical protein n=1 Tax=Acetobacterium sp. TaxID=1872094 RepID=UPI002F3F42E5
MKKRYFIIGILLITVLVASTFYILPKLVAKSNDTNVTASTTKADPTTTGNTTPEGDPATSEKDAASNQPSTTPTTSIVIPEEMQTIIDENSDYLYEDTTAALATDYPSQMIPLYDVLGVSDSKAMTSDKGNPGWLTSYVSEDSTDEILAFYRPLLTTMSDFSEENISASTNLKATVSGYAISLTVAPNNPQKTDIQGNSSVSISIEQV